MVHLENPIPDPMRPDPTQRQTALRVEELQIPAGDATLEGTLQWPVNASGLVLFAHGSGSSRHSPRNRFVAESLIKAGMGTFLFDLLTRKEERLDAESGQWRFNIIFLARRLLAATDWIMQSRRKEIRALGFFGASTGAAAALVGAAELGEQVLAVVSRGGRPDLAGESLPRVRAATLLLVGSHDTEVIRLNEQAYTQLECQKELVLIPGAGHLFEEPGTLGEVARLASSWFRHYFETTS